MNQNPFSLYDFLGYLIPGILFLILFQFEDFVNIDILNWQNCEVIGYTVLVVISYVSGHIISIASSRTIEDYHIWLNGYPSKNIFVTKHKPKKTSFYLKIVIVFIFPIFLIDHICRSVFKHKSKTMDPSLSRIVLKKLVKFFKNFDKKAANEIKQSKYLCNDLFRYVNHYANERTKEHIPKFLNYVALYGFSRSMSLLFTILFDLELISLVGTLFHRNKVPTATITLLIASLILGYIFYLSYAKFFRRYTQEVIMAFATNYNLNDKSASVTRRH